MATYDLVIRLLKRYPVDALNKKGQTPLMLAACLGNIPLMNLLLKNGACVDKCDLYGRNLLHYALDKSSSLEAALLILPLLKNPNQADRFGLTPFMKAAGTGFIAIMRFLLETKHDIHAVNDNGYNALHLAAIADQAESIAFLARNRFSIDQPVMPTKEKKIARSRQQTPLHLAAQYGRENAMFELIKHNADLKRRQVWI